VITVRFFKLGGKINGVETSGHAMESSGRIRFFQPQHETEYGNILCASVSILMFHLQAGFEAVAMIPVRISKEKKNGLFRIELERQKDTKAARPYFLNLMVTMGNLEKKYPGRLQIIEEKKKI
jgi:uncharacterized protein YsxB (DUF464 family)